MLMWGCSQNQSDEGRSGRTWVAKSEMAETKDAVPLQQSIEITSTSKKNAVNESSASVNQSHSPQTFISSSAALVNPNDTTRRMIRTANIRFKTKDVITTTYGIEDIVVKHNGFVENSNLQSRIDRTNKMQIKEDSILLVSYYTVTNSLVLRVPNTQLDATLREIAQFVEFMDYRVINAKNVTFELLSKRLEQDRLARFDRRLTNAIDNQGRRLNDVNDAEDNLLSRQAQADEAKIAKLRIFDEIEFSTITLSLYQNQSIKYEVIAIEKAIKPYFVPFGTRFIDAFKSGWNIIVDFFLFLINIWSIILTGILIFYVVKYLKKRTAKKTAS